MAKTTKVLSGAAKNAYFQRVVGAETKLAREVREKLTGRLQGEITQLRVRTSALHVRLVPAAPVVEPAAAPPTQEPGVAGAFDPYSPNVVVMVRTEGPAAALAALHVIAEPENLRRLAREQQLGIDAGLATPAEICAAIVAAAERRIANRRAAAS